MLIFIEGEDYPIDILSSAFDDSKFYIQKGDLGKIISVGYYRSCDKNNLIFMLPKVFMADRDQTVFGISKSELTNTTYKDALSFGTHYNWVRQLSIHFYNSLQEFRKRHYNNTILREGKTFDLNTNISEKEFSYLDLFLSIFNFYKKNNKFILYKHIEHLSNQVRKPKWEKTIRKSLPLLIDNKPFYPEIANKVKAPNKEEELITYFLSIVNFFNTQHDLGIKLDKSYVILKDLAFDALCKNGLVKLKRIRYRYFSDVLKRMYHLCEIFFTYQNASTVKKKRDEFISISNYNIVFEDMIDKLFSETLYDKETVTGYSIEKLKNNSDGKIIDHIFDYKSLIDTANIFYIGDSKYYKSGSAANGISSYKQQSYAKNVIQFNIDLLNDGRNYSHIRYRDDLTDGYNITPNFFIYGHVEKAEDYSKHGITAVHSVIPTFHFPDRLFDRDTLFVHQYRINFLFVLKSYTAFSIAEYNNFRRETKRAFRSRLISYFADENTCKFEFYLFLENEDKTRFIFENYRLLCGKCYNTSDNQLILAKHIDDNSLITLINLFVKIVDIKAFMN